MVGRSLTVYEKLYPESELNTQTAHQQFLDALAALLPDGCKPIIVSDAIYRAPWFTAVEEKDWYWIGRVRGQVSLSKDKREWETSYQWFKRAKVGKPEHLGSIYYGKAAKFECNAVIYKRSAKGRVAKKMRGGTSQRTTDEIHEKDAKEPWLLVFKLPAKYNNNTKMAVKLYSQRMQIEENFRDTKNAKLGIGLKYANSKSVERFDNLLLIAALILFFLWCVGFTAVMNKIHYSLQANTIRTRMVLSIITIGREIIDDDRYVISSEECADVLNQLSLLVVRINDLHKC